MTARLRTGRDYHLAEATRILDPFERPTGKWVAVCDACGWVGETRDCKWAAADDAAAHDIAENG